MRIAVGADHAGFPLKESVIQVVKAAGHAVLDLGAFAAEPSDYPDFALAVGRAIQEGRAERGILLCGSGVGASIAANKLHGIRAGLCHDSYSAHQCVEHDNANILCLGPRIIGPALLAELVIAFLGAQFTGEERHRRRLDKIAAMEKMG
ncbi:MAG: ribose 5-phosphate isomerase [Chloroflexota bacterium]|nr:ribose 5-phosphate isomerase [Chloroflexota bacterium]